MMHLKIEEEIKLRKALLAIVLLELIIYSFILSMITVAFIFFR